MADGVRNPSAVLFRELRAASGHRIGIATLNAEKSLNALSLDMVRLLAPKLKQWAQDPALACVMIDGAGEKAFCAGGDVRSLREAILARPDAVPNPECEAFFGEEYRLDHAIHTYPKPLLVWGGGIVMGGGLGLLAGASHRIVTDTSRLAMPEISIGLYPEVGASWFLRRMPGRCGLFMGLTGAQLNGHDALFVGVADFFLRDAERQALLEVLASLAWTDSAAANRRLLSQALRPLADAAAAFMPASNVQRHYAEIQRLTDGASLVDVVAAITAYAGGDGWLKKAAATLAAGSPTTAALTWEIWRRARHMSLAEVFRMELVVSLQCSAHPDFPEGVRAVLVDKDMRPNWTPKTVAEISEEWVAAHFVEPWSPWLNQSNPLAQLAA